MTQLFPPPRAVTRYAAPERVREHRPGERDREPVCPRCHGEGAITLIIPSPVNRWRGVETVAPCHECDGGEI